jgi:hypothetical protein
MKLFGSRLKVQWGYHPYRYFRCSKWKELAYWSMDKLTTIVGKQPLSISNSQSRDKAIPGTSNSHT